MAAWVYMLRCVDGSLYTGAAIDPVARWRIHSSGKGAKYTRSRLPVELVYQRRCRDLAEAQRFEAAIKKFTRSQKEELLRGKIKLSRRHLLQTAKNKPELPRRA